MQGRKAFWSGLLVVPFLILAVSSGCKRNYPARPTFLATYTPTPYLSYTFTITATPTLSPTKTNTVTPTKTATGQATSTFTLSPTMTLTPTITPTPTPTLTPTATSTPKPPVGIDDLEDGNTTINSVLGITNPGSWYGQGDGTCSPVLSVAAPGANSSNYCIQLTGSGCATFGALGFWFFDDTVQYGSYTDVYSNSTGIRFDIRQEGGNVSSVRFEYLDDFSANGIPGNSCGTNCGPGYGQDLVVNGTWKTVTVFWDQCTLPTWYTGTHARDPWQMYGVHWIVNANGANYGIQVDNVTLINDVPPPTPTPDCHMIDDMEDNDNRSIIYSAGNCGSDGSIGLHGGYWYTYQDALGGTMFPGTTDKFGMSAPGHNSSYAARITGVNSDTTGDIYAGMGLNLLEPKGFYDMTNGGKYSGIQFDAMVGASTAVSIRFKIPDFDTDPNGGVCSKCYDDFGQDMVLTENWITYQLPFSSLTQVGFGDVAGSFNPQRASALQWQFTSSGVTFDLWVDNVQFY